MKRILLISLWMVIFAGVLVVLGFATAEKRRVTCSKLVVFVNDNLKTTFINKDEIYRYIYDKFGTLAGKPLTGISSLQIEKTLLSNPYIFSVNVYMSLNGEIIVDIEREKPLLKIINSYNERFYLTWSGRPVPLKEDYVPRTFVASGKIEKHFSEITTEHFSNYSDSIPGIPMLTRLHYLALTLEKNEYFKQDIEQIYVNKDSQIELVPSVGHFLVLLGDVDNLQTRLENLLAFYNAGLPKIEKSNFRVIDAQYVNQIVCKK